MEPLIGSRMAKGKLKLKEKIMDIADKLLRFAYGDYIATLLENRLNKQICRNHPH